MSVPGPSVDTMTTTASPTARPLRAALSPSRAADFKQCPLLYRFRVIDRIEDATGVPAVSSNYAAAWAVLRACGDTGAAAPGALMRTP